jgi:solute carrier family 13 (sodium-dependent dicarboxylate transporter), member 2/3/5
VRPARLRGAELEESTDARAGLVGRVGLVAGPAAFAVLLLVPLPAGMPEAAMQTAAVTAWTAIWWITEPIPVPATSLIPLVLLPATGARTPAEAASGFANPLIFVFLGGFMMALAVERWDLHRRMAVSVLRVVGGGPARITLGFMLATAFLSMWISNTASTMLMIPMALAVISRVAAGRDPAATAPFAAGLVLAIAYAASIGGIATLIGTPPNIVLAGVARTIDHQVDFARWMLFALPPATLALLAVWVFLTRIAFRIHGFAIDPGAISAERASLGRMNAAERRVALVGAAVATAWITRPILIAPVFPVVDDAVIALAGALVMFALPSGTVAGTRLLDWADTARLPWGLILLFGGGLGIADAFSATGLAAWIGDRLAGLAGLPPILVVTAVVAVIVVLTEVSSNSAVASMALPVLVGVAAAVGVEPLLLMIPAAVAASCAFMLPVATPPNAIAYGSGYVSLRTMARTGLVLNLGSIVLIGPLTYLILPHTGLLG